MNTSVVRSKLVPVVGALAVAFGLIGSPAALADNKVVVDKVEIRFGDLNLETEAGAQALIARLKGAATRACGGRLSALGPISGRVAARRTFDSCHDVAMQAAIVDVNRPLVTQAYLGDHTIDKRVAQR